MSHLKKQFCPEKSNVVVRKRKKQCTFSSQLYSMRKRKKNSFPRLWFFASLLSNVQSMSSRYIIFLNMSHQATFYMNRNITLDGYVTASIRNISFCWKYPELFLFITKDKKTTSPIGLINSFSKLLEKICINECFHFSIITF